MAVFANNPVVAQMAKRRDALNAKYTELGKIDNLDTLREITRADTFPKMLDDATREFDEISAMLEAAKRAVTNARTAEFDVHYEEGRALSDPFKLREQVKIAREVELICQEACSTALYICARLRAQIRKT